VNLAWSTNQSVEFYIDDDIEFNGKSIYIYTGVNDNYELIGVVSKPVKSFEVLCVNSDTRDFIIK
jgi:hypothetical protein